jgi:hypothetical protein
MYRDGYKAGAKRLAAAHARMRGFFFWAREVSEQSLTFGLGFACSVSVVGDGQTAFFVTRRALLAQPLGK